VLIAYSLAELPTTPLSELKPIELFTGLTTEEGYLLYQGSRVGLSALEYFKLRMRSRGRCEICGDSPRGKQQRRLHIDHDHETGEVRGLLCHYCNVQLPRLARLRPDLAPKIAAYLKEEVTLPIAA
jgi:hypothetical protein